MIKINNSTTNGALDSEGVSPTSDFTFTPSASPIGFTRTTFTAPPLPGSDWDTVFSGVCVDLMNQSPVTDQLVLKGDKLVLTRPTQLSVCMTVDDHGDLLISNSELADDAIQSAFDTAPKLSNHEADILNFANSVCFHTDLQGTEWQDFDSGAAAWKRPVRTLILPAGEYFIYGRVTNDPMKGGNANNRKLFRYALLAKQACAPREYQGGLPQVCNSCGCGNTTDGDADRHASTQAPGWEGDVCPSFVTLNPATGKALYDSPWRWKAAIAGAQVVITPPVGEALLFAIPAEDSAPSATTPTVRVRRIPLWSMAIHTSSLNNATALVALLDTLTPRMARCIRRLRLDMGTMGALLPPGSVTAASKNSSATHTSPALICCRYSPSPTA